VPDGFEGIPWGANRDEVTKTMSERGYSHVKPEPNEPLQFHGKDVIVPGKLFFYFRYNSFYKVEAYYYDESPQPEPARQFFQKLFKAHLDKYFMPKLHDVNSRKDDCYRCQGNTILESARWETVDAKSDRYTIGISLGEYTGMGRKKGYFVHLTYEADSLLERLKKTGY